MERQVAVFGLPWSGADFARHRLLKLGVDLVDLEPIPDVIHCFMRTGLIVWVDSSDELRMLRAAWVGHSQRTAETRKAFEREREALLSRRLVDRNQPSLAYARLWAQVFIHNNQGLTQFGRCLDQVAIGLTYPEFMSFCSWFVSKLRQTYFQQLVMGAP